MKIDKDVALALLSKLKSKNENLDKPAIMKDDIANLEKMILDSNSDYDTLSIVANNFDRKTTIRLLPFNVVAIDSDGRFTTFLSTDGTKYLASRVSLSTVEEKWGEHFVRISRNTLLNPTKIERVIRSKGGHEAILIDSLGRFDVSRRQVKTLKENLK